MTPSFIITDHALQRWRERVAANVNETAVDMLAALANAQRLCDGDMMPFRRDRGMSYFYSLDKCVYFVVDQRSLRFARVVTVISM